MAHVHYGEVKSRIQTCDSSITVQFLPNRSSKSEITSCGCQLRPVTDGTFGTDGTNYNIILQLHYILYNRLRDMNLNFFGTNLLQL